MTFKELALKRESCRSYLDKEVDRQTVTDILETALLSPSACNSQPWKFVVCDGETAKLIPPIVQAYGLNKWADNVPCFVVVCETEAKLMDGVRQTFARMDVGIAAAGFCYAAADKGLGTCIMGSFDKAKLKELLHVPEDIKVRLVLALGWPANQEPRQKRRAPFAEKASFNRW